MYLIQRTESSENKQRVKIVRPHFIIDLVFNFGVWVQDIPISLILFDLISVYYFNMFSQMLTILTENSKIGRRLNGNS